MNDNPKVVCPHCAHIIDEENLSSSRKYRNGLEIEVFKCAKCGGSFKVDPTEYLFVAQEMKSETPPKTMAVSGYEPEELMPSEETAIKYAAKPRTRRYVPFITGLISLGLFYWMMFGITGWWRWIPASFLAAFAWLSFKTAFFASDKEIQELTGESPITEETKKKLEERF